MKTRILVVGVVVSLLLMAATAHAQSELSKIAASMKPGEWKAFSPTGWDGSLDPPCQLDALGKCFGSGILSPKNLGGTLEVSLADYITQYHNGIPWARGKASFVGLAHGYAHAGAFLQFDEATNTIRQGPWPSSFICQSRNTDPNCNPTHGYDHNTADPETGDVYYHHFADRLGFYRLRYNTTTWERLPTLPSWSISCCASWEYVPKLGAVYVDADWGIWLYRPSTNDWTLLADTNSAATGRHPEVPLVGPMGGGMWASWSAARNVLYFGAIRQAFSMSADGKTFQRLADPPVDFAAGQLSLNTLDPVSGNPLALVGPTMFQYDPDENKWEVINTTIPFADPSNGAGETVIPEYGITMFMKYDPGCRYNPDGTSYCGAPIWLYKHNPNATTDVPPLPDDDPPHWIRVTPGTDYCTPLNTATPGKEVVFTTGRGEYLSPCKILVSGTPEAPIIIRSDSDTVEATLSYPGGSQNILEVHGSNVIIRGLRFKPANDAVTSLRLMQVSNVTIEKNTFTGTGNAYLTAHSGNTNKIVIRENKFLDLKNLAIYIGCHEGECKSTDFLIERNFIDKVYPVDPASTGYGMQVKIDSWGVIRDNTVFDTYGPGIMVYGSRSGSPENVVEGNYADTSRRDGAIVIGGGPALVRNNITRGGLDGISVQNYAQRNIGSNIKILNNTIIDPVEAGIYAFGWLTNNTLANNVILNSATSKPFNLSTPATVDVNNHVCASAASCFVNATSAPYDLWPAVGSPLLDKPTNQYVPADDFMGIVRGTTPDIGALERTATANNHLVDGTALRPPRIDGSQPPPPPVNRAPVVVCAPDQTITLPASASLFASATDDGLPVGATLTYQWFGTGVTFGSPLALTTTATAAAGTYTVNFTASDGTLTSTPCSLTLTVNPAPQPPGNPVVKTITVSGTSPLAGTVTVSAVAEDDKGVVGVRFQIDGLNLSTEDTVTPYSRSWNTETATNGAHVITVIARDADGNTGTGTLNVTVNNVDTVAPTVTITSHKDGQTITGNVVNNITVRAIDNKAGNVVKVELWVNGLYVSHQGDGTSAIPDSNPLDWRLRSLPAGTHTVKAVAYDRAGNKGEVTITLRK